MPLCVCSVTQLYLTLCNSTMPIIQLNLLSVLSLSSTFPKESEVLGSLYLKTVWRHFLIRFWFSPLVPRWSTGILPCGNPQPEKLTWSAPVCVGDPRPLQCIWSPTPWFPTLLWSWVLLFHVLRVSFSLSSKLCFTSLRQSRKYLLICYIYMYLEAKCIYE